MEIKRFDEVEFKAIQCGDKGGYYSDGTEPAKRAIMLMDEGVYEFNPVKNWIMTGWKFTKFGKEYYKEFMKLVHEKHGHVWKTNKDSHPDWYSDEDGAYADQIDIFAYESGHHNGPKCKNCGYEFCHHCETEMAIPVCTQRR